MRFSLARAGEVGQLMIENLVGLIVGFALLIYLFIALLYPDRF